ncbi:MAG: rRNA pseudouridine synthase [Oscillatoriales cyanobacterium RM2_1_1]|nr:rRNA pseudouridine synthase [Oscillatoriales cyanobacterium SM2_3_0]NJO47826.1 rRNA pseudouridine synthase [Oscillatoriales cyanobacterium RM2_1_1]
MDERLQKVIAQWGVASRRQAEQMIQAGRIRINGGVAQLGQKVNLSSDCIEIDGKLLKPAQRPELIYLLLNKPRGVISTCTEPQERRTVLDCLPHHLQSGQGIHPIGRLDANSTGALLLTNDGEMTYRLTHPKYHVPKTYQVWVQGYPSDAVLQQWRQGIDLSGQQTLPAKVQRLKHHNKSQTLLEVILVEGRNRQIRRVAEQLGHPVIHLHRTTIGSIQLHSPGQPRLAAGESRPLTDSELFFLNNSSFPSSSASAEDSAATKE